MLVFFTSSIALNLVLTILVYISIIIILLIVGTTIKLDVEYMEYNYKMIIKFFLFNKVKYFQLKFEKGKLKSLSKKLEKSLKKFNIFGVENKYLNNKKLYKNILKRVDLNIDYLNIDLKLGTEFILLTSVIIVTISAIFPIIINKFIKRYNSDNYIYKFTPEYNKNIINLKLNCIISVKMVHIINTIIYILFNKGDIKNVRTSNSRFNDNCYE